MGVCPGPPRLAAVGGGVYVSSTEAAREGVTLQDEAAAMRGPLMALPPWAQELGRCYCQAHRPTQLRARGQGAGAKRGPCRSAPQGTGRGKGGGWL